MFCPGHSARPAGATALVLYVGLALSVGAALGAGAVKADDVFLENGNSFLGVMVVRETAETVRIRLAYGEMTLPRSWVEHIDRAASPLEEFLERRSRLTDAGGTDWLELARWARAHGLDHGYREALLEAALLEPHLPGLAAHMREIDHEFDSDAGLWFSAAERRREAEAALAAERLAAERARTAAAASSPAASDSTTEGTLSRAVEALALAELERETRRSRESESFHGGRAHYPVQTVTGYGTLYPVAYFPGVVPAPAPSEDGATSTVQDPYASLGRRQPGSLLVTRPGGGRVSALSRVRRQPGSLALGNR